MCPARGDDAGLGHRHRLHGPIGGNTRRTTNATYAQGMRRWIGYAYLHKDRDVATASSATYGLRWRGSTLQPEATRQVDYANNPVHFAHSYGLASRPGAGRAPHEAGVGAPGR